MHLHSLTRAELIQRVESLEFVLKEMTSTPTGFVEGLTKSESAAVAYLMKHPHVVRTKEQILHAIYWDRPGADYAQDEVIRVLIHKIRRKRPDINIRNIHGLGYVFEPPATTYPPIPSEF